MLWSKRSCIYPYVLLSRSNSVDLHPYIPYCSWMIWPSYDRTGKYKYFLMWEGDILSEIKDISPFLIDQQNVEMTGYPKAVYMHSIRLLRTGFRYM